MDDLPPASCMRFGSLALHPESRTVWLNNVPAQLGARSFDLLLALLRHRGQVLGKQALLDLVWPGVVVEENNLQVQICALRKVLGPQTIVTVPGRGYGLAAREDDEGGGPQPVSGGDAHQSALHGGNQAIPLTPLRGRDAELRALRGLLDTQRLTSVVGPGGVGKSRLAQAAVSEQAGRFPGGVWTIDLSSLNRRSSIATAVSRVLRRRAGQHGATPAQLAHSLAGQPLLLVLENCEHVLDGAGELALALLEHAPDTHLLITSQAPLKIKGEHLLRLAPLEIPPDDAAAAPQGPALDLFADTVQALQPRAPLAGGELHDAVAICRHLDGIPLAIELAASRVPVLGVSGVRRRLGDRFNVLTSDAREATSRQRSMAACLEWSWRLLDGPEQSLLAALCRFKGRFTLRTARVALGPSLSEWQAMALLGALIDKSMIIQTPGSRRAFRLLETTRLFVQQRAGRGSALPADRLAPCASLASTPDSRPPASAWSTWPATR